MPLPPIIGNLVRTRSLTNQCQRDFNRRWCCPEKYFRHEKKIEPFSLGTYVRQTTSGFRSFPPPSTLRIAPIKGSTKQWLTRLLLSADRWVWRLSLASGGPLLDGNPRAASVTCDATVGRRRLHSRLSLVPAICYGHVARLRTHYEYSVCVD